MASREALQLAMLVDRSWGRRGEADLFEFRWQGGKQDWTDQGEENGENKKELAKYDKYSNDCYNIKMQCSSSSDLMVE